MTFDILNESTDSGYYMLRVKPPKSPSVMILVSKEPNRSRPITVCVENGMKGNWRGLGRDFRSFEEAKAGYKSAGVRAAIDLALERTLSNDKLVEAEK